jgi:hypothetical protein
LVVNAASRYPFRGKYGPLRPRIALVFRRYCLPILARKTPAFVSGHDFSHSVPLVR